MVVPSGTQTELGAGGTADASFAWLYPYDKTVFPRGLLPPTLQFGGTASDAAYVHVTFPGFELQGYYGAVEPGGAVKLSARRVDGDHRGGARQRP